MSRSVDAKQAHGPQSHKVWGGNQTAGVVCPFQRWTKLRATVLEGKRPVALVEASSRAAVLEGDSPPLAKYSSFFTHNSVITGDTAVSHAARWARLAARAYSPTSVWVEAGPARAEFNVLARSRAACQDRRISPHDAGKIVIERHLEHLVWSICRLLDGARLVLYRAWRDSAVYLDVKRPE